MVKLEDFKKLKQNDRIEFMLRWNHLKEKQKPLYFDWSFIMYLLFAIIGFITLLSMQFYILGYEETFIKLLSIIGYLSTIIFMVVIFGVIYNLIVELSIFKKLRKELEEEFFKTETKPRK